MKKNIGLIIDVIKYTLFWLFGLGILSVYAVPFYFYLVEEIGLFVYLVFPFLGLATKWYFSIEKTYTSGDME